jgi:uncharacterized membrane protein YjdF
MDEGDYTEPTARLSTWLEIPVVMVTLFAGAAFLTKMCYLSLVFNTIFFVVFLALFYFYVNTRLRLRIPVMLLGLVFLALQVDALGNYFRMYGRQFGPMQYDEFSHMTVQVLVSPLIVWLVSNILHRNNYRLPLRLSAFFAATIVFSLSAMYEIIELWDEIYFGGRRIWGPYDSATDLQWDFCGIIVGTVFSCMILRNPLSLPPPVKGCEFSKFSRNQLISPPAQVRGQVVRDSPAELGPRCVGWWRNI